MSQLTAQQKQTVQRLNGAGFRAKMKSTLPQHITPDTMVRIVLNEFIKQPKLLECTPESLQLSILDACTLGLRLASVSGEAYLVPVWSGKRRQFECSLWPGYRGYIKLARQSGEIKQIRAHIVYANEYFRLEAGTESRIEHTPIIDDSDPGEMIGVYAVAEFKDGGYQFHYMTRRQVNKVRDSSKSKDKNGNVYGPWLDYYEEMSKKSAIRALMKYLPMEAEKLAQADAVESGGHPSQEMEPLDIDAMDFSVSDAEPPATRGDSIAAKMGVEPEPEAPKTLSGMIVKYNLDGCKEVAKLVAAHEQSGANGFWGCWNEEVNPDQSADIAAITAMVGEIKARPEVLGAA